MKHKSGGIERLFKKSHQHMRRNIEQHLATLIPAGQVPAAPLPLVADYLAGAILSMLTWWLDNEMPYTPERWTRCSSSWCGPAYKRRFRLS